MISNYAACAPLTVTVTDTAGSPVEGATVEFKLFSTPVLHRIAQNDRRPGAGVAVGGSRQCVHGCL